MSCYDGTDFALEVKLNVTDSFSVKGGYRPEAVKTLFTCGR